MSLAPFSTAAHAERQIAGGELVREATPRATIVPMRQAAPAASRPVASEAVVERPAPQSQHWLTQINDVRASAGLLPVVEEVAWSVGGRLHSRYMVKNNYVGHHEDVGNPWYTPAGHAAGQNGNAYANYAHDTTDPPGIEAWLTTPFHLLSVLDPRLARTGFGWYRADPEDPGSDLDPDVYQIGATLDVARGLDPEREAPGYPIFFPGDGEQIPYGRYFGSEYPDPLTGCPDRGFQGAPLLVQLAETPWVTSVVLTKDGVQLDRCVFDETTYWNDDPEAAWIGREVLAVRHAVVIMPREPLTAGIYRVTLVDAGVTHSWEFAGPDTESSPSRAR